MQHFTRNTIEVEQWCRKCKKPTMHRVDGVKLGPCLVCLRRLELAAADRRQEPEQSELFPSPKK
jgi:ribosomal protein L44E